MSLILLQKHNQENGYFTYCQASEYTAYKDYGGKMFYSMYLCYLLRYYVYLDTVILALRKVTYYTMSWTLDLFTSTF